MVRHNFFNCRKINWLSSKNILNVIATYYQCLGLKAQNTTSIDQFFFITHFHQCENKEPTVIKKANHFVSFEFTDVQLLEFMNLLGGAASLDSFFEAYKTSETKSFFPYDWFDCPQKMNNSELPPYNSFFSKLRNVNPLEKDHSDYQKLLCCGFKAEEALSKMKLSKPPTSGEENTNICLICGIMRICAHLKTFYAGTTTETLSQYSKQCRKCLLFITIKELTCWSSGVNFPIWQIFVSTNLAVPNSIHLLKLIKTFCKRFEKIWLVVLLSTYHVKL